MVSIILPNYNHAAFLKQRIDSILNQTYQDFELIILDDCSTDNSREIIEQYAHHPKVSNIIFNETNSGSPFLQWQKGAKFSRGEWIWIAESDDACELDLLEKLIAEGCDYDSCGLRYATSVKINEENKKLEEPFPSIPQGVYRGIDFLNEYLLRINNIPNASAVLVRKDLLENEFTNDVLQFKLVGDWMMWCKICLKTDVYFVSTVNNFHRFHERTKRKESMKSDGYFYEFPTFRKKLTSVIGSVKDAELKRRMLKKNAQYKYVEIGKLGTERIRNKKYFQSIAPLLVATFLPKPTFYFLKSAAYWLVKGNQ